MLKRLKELNLGIPFFSVSDEEFLKYGKVIHCICPNGFIDAAQSLELPKYGTTYLPSCEVLEAVPQAKEIADFCFGEMPTQIGCCFGHNSLMNATEWHTSSEINIAVTDLVLILGHLWDIKDKKIDSSDFKAFYVPKGTAIEVYATTLHFCPCQVSDDGFICIVCLPNGTNTPLENKADDPLLFRKNKWILAHNENEELIARGVIPGISGVNYKLNY